MGLQLEVRMLKNIWEAPTSTAIGAMVCLAAVAIAAMCTDNASFLRDLLMVLGGGALGIGALKE